MSILSGAGKEAGSEAAAIGAKAIDHASDAVGAAAKDIGEELADVTSVTADAINRLNRTIADESAEWRKSADALTAQVARFNDFLDRIAIGSPKT